MGFSHIFPFTFLSSLKEQCCSLHSSQATFVNEEKRCCLCVSCDFPHGRISEQYKSPCNTEIPLSSACLQVIIGLLDNADELIFFSQITMSKSSFTTAHALTKQNHFLGNETNEWWWFKSPPSKQLPCFCCKQMMFTHLMNTFIT